MPLPPSSLGSIALCAHTICVFGCLEIRVSVLLRSCVSGAVVNTCRRDRQAFAHELACDIEDDAAHGRLRDLYKKWSKCFGAILAKTRIAWRTHSTGEFVFAPREEANILLSTFQLGFGRARGHVGASKPKVYCHYWHVRYRGTSLRLSVILPIATITKPIAERIQQGASRWFSIALRMAPSAVLAPPPNCLVGLAAWLVSRLAAWLLGCRGCAGCPDCTGCPGSPDHPIYMYIYIYIYIYTYIHIYIYIYIKAQWRGGTCGRSRWPQRHAGGRR